MDLAIQISLVFICLFIMWRMFRVVKANPEMLSKAHMMKSFTTIGIIALILIGAVTMMVLLLRT